MSENLRGIVGAPTTPFNSDNKVDLDLFAKQVNFLIESGISLLAHPMHIGESLSMSEDERKDLARTLVEAANGRVPTFVHVSSAGTDNSIAMAEHSAKVGSTGIVLLAPYYWRPTDEYIIEHFRQVTKAHGGKFIAYNNPNATNVVLTPEIISLFIDELPGLVAIKDATFHMETFGKFCSLASEANNGISVYTGIEHLLTSMPSGGSGCFSACSEVAPRLVLELFKACDEANIEVARELQYKTWRLLKLLMTDYPSTIKYCMELMGRPIGIARKPIRALNEENKRHAKKELEEMGIFNSEKQGW
jgi:dihydrodipicolinate synthase/N-acetylneuraminate lyase